MREAITAAGVDFSQGAMVALYPRQNEALELAVAGGQAADDLHVTLIYLGSVADVVSSIELVQAVAGGVASETESLAGTVGGIAVFDEGPDGAPLVLLPDVPGLTELGIALRGELALIGVESPSEHGFEPHLTVSYGGSPADVPGRIGQTLHFDAISVVIGNDRFDYDLQSPPQTLLADADCPCASLPSGGTMKPRKTLTAADAAPTNASQLRWRSLLMVEGKPTDDGRMIELGAIDWRELPLSLMAMVETSAGGHEGATLAGRIDKIWRAEAPNGVNEIWGEGIFDDSEFGTEVARLVDERMLRGVSVDLAIREFEWRPKTDPEGAEKEIDDEGDILDLLFGDDMLYVVTDGSIGAATVCPFPAFADAEISLVASSPMVWRHTAQSGMIVVGAPASTDSESQSSGEQADDPVGVTASAAGLAPLIPLAEWFTDPDLEEPTPLQITDDGRVFGHVAVWDACHLGFDNECVLAPRSKAEYDYFHLGEVVVEVESDGENVLAEPRPCGQITLGTGHANLRLSREAAVEHYDDTGTAVADVVVGEDDFGIWFSGALRSDVAAERVRELRGSKLSGDWRNVAGNLEMVAVLAVNVPGFPVPRVRVASADTEPVAAALLAAGVADKRLLEAMRDRAEAERRIADLAAEGRGMEDLIARARGEYVLQAA